MADVAGAVGSGPGLAGVRSAGALAGLPEPERRGWQALWAEVDSLIGSLKTDPNRTDTPRSR